MQDIVIDSSHAQLTHQHRSKNNEFGSLCVNIPVSQAMIEEAFLLHFVYLYCGPVSFVSIASFQSIIDCGLLQSQKTALSNVEVQLTYHGEQESSLF